MIVTLYLSDDGFAFDGGCEGSFPVGDYDLADSHGISFSAIPLPQGGSSIVGTLAGEVTDPLVPQLDSRHRFFVEAGGRRHWLRRIPKEG